MTHLDQGTSAPPADNDSASIESPQPSPAEQHKKPGNRYPKILVILVVVCGLLLVLLPLGVRFGVVYWLNQQPGVSASIDSIGINLFTGTIQINNAAISKNGANKFRVVHALLEVDWMPLSQRNFSVNHLDIDDGQIEFNYNEKQQIFLAGFLLNPPHETEPLEEKIAPGPAQPWGINSGNINIHNFTITGQFEATPLHIHIGNMAIEPLISWQPNLPSPIAATISVNDSKIILDGQLQPFADRFVIDGTLAIQNFDLGSIGNILQQQGLNDVGGTIDAKLDVTVLGKNTDHALHIAVQGDLGATKFRATTPNVWLKEINSNWNGNIAIDIKDGSVQVAATDSLTVNNAQIQLLASGISLQQKQLTWEGSFKFNSTDATTTSQILGDLALNGTSVDHLKKQLRAIDIKQLLIDNLEIDDLTSIAINKVTIQQLQALQRHDTANTPYSISLQDGQIEHINIDNLQDLTINNVNLSMLQVELARNPELLLDIQHWFNNEIQLENSEPTLDAEPAATTQSHLKLHHLAINNSSFRFDDYGTTTPVALLFNNVNCNINNLDNGDATQRSSFDYTSSIGRHGQIALKGDIAPFSDTIDLDLSGKINDFNLTTVSPYVEQVFGLDIQQGHLDYDFTLPVIANDVNMASDIHLHRFKMVAITDEAVERTSKNFGMPLNLALSLLRDRQGDITLSLPVKGNLSQPDFKIGPAMRLALVNGIKNTLMLTLTPFGVISSAGKMIGIGKALTFKPVVFAPDTTEIDASGQEYLQQIHQLLAKQPNLILAINGQITDADLQKMQSTTGTSSKTITTARRRDLAQKRARAVEDALLSFGDIKKSQLLLNHTRGKINDGEPRVDLSLQ